MDRRDYLKPSRFGNAEKRRLLDTKNLKEKRSIRRTTNFNLRRDIDYIVEEEKTNTIENVPPKSNKVIDRKYALQKFRAEKEAQKKALKEKMKPPFVVGIPHHGASPLLRNLNAENKTKKETNSTRPTALEVRSKRITRATTRTVQANVLKEKPKINEQPRNAHFFKAPPSVKIFPFKENKPLFAFKSYNVTLSSKKLTSPHTPTVLKRSVQKKPLKNVSNLVLKLKKSPERSPQYDADEELAAPLSMSQEVDAEKQEEPAIGRTRSSKNRVEPSERMSAKFSKNHEIKVEQDEDEGVDIRGDDISRELPSQSQQSNKYTMLRRNPKRSQQHESDVSPKSEEVDEKGSQEVTAQKRNETPKSVSPPLTEDSEHQQNEEEGVNNSEAKELANQVAFQHSRLQSETTRLLELADQWQAMVLRGEDVLPQDVVDEVDSLVGQTRLLTGDKFQQFRRLVVQYEQKTGTHPVTWDDLNGFWDMVYLQVESLDKRYTALVSLKNNNWVRPEPAIKKKRRPVKNVKVKKVTESEKSSTPEMKRKRFGWPQLPNDQEMQTQTTDVKLNISNVLLSTKRTHSNSPSPYIAMRLSGIGRTPNTMVQLPETNGTPRSTLVGSTEACGTSKSVLNKSCSTRNQTSMLSSKATIGVHIDELEHLSDTEEHSLVPAKTPRRSMRLMTKSLLQTPVSSCSVCVPASDDRSNSTKISSTKKTRSSKKLLKFSPSETQQKSYSATVTEPTQTDETYINKPSTSGVRFSLRPSILAAVSENNNINEIPKKAKKRNRLSVSTASTSVNQDSERSKNQRSTRQSRKVTFESGAEEKSSFKLPATPYRKSEADS